MGLGRDLAHDRRRGYLLCMALVAKRKDRALDAIRRAAGTEADHYSIALFIEHHLEQLPASYWKQHLGSESPAPSAVLGLLELHSSWGEGDVENFDFTLPGQVTDHKICVRFDVAGTIVGIEMES